MTLENIVKNWKFIEAMKNGKIIEHRAPGDRQWAPIFNPSFTDPPESYRIKMDPPKELWAVYSEAGGLEVVRENKEAADTWAGKIPNVYTVVHLREVREETTV